MKNTVILKSYKDGIAIYLDDTLEFEQLCLDLAQKFRDSARFFGDMQVAVSFEGRTRLPEHLPADFGAGDPVSASGTDFFVLDEGHRYFS